MCIYIHIHTYIANTHVCIYIHMCAYWRYMCVAILQLLLAIAFLSLVLCIAPNNESSSWWLEMETRDKERHY